MKIWLKIIIFIGVMLFGFCGDWFIDENIYLGTLWLIFGLDLIWLIVLTEKNKKNRSA